MGKNRSKSGYSREGLFGDIIHYDSKGHKIGESRPSLFGGYNNYDAKGHKVGESRPGFLRYNTYDAKGHKVGSTTDGFFGTKNHYDSSGHRNGSTRETFSLTASQVNESMGDTTTMINQAGSAAGLRHDRNFQTAVAVTAGMTTSKEAENNANQTHAAYQRKSYEYDGYLDDEDLDEDDTPENSGLLRYVIAWQGPGYHTSNYSVEDESVEVGDYIIPEYPPIAMEVLAVVECLPEAFPNCSMMKVYKKL